LPAAILPPYLHPAVFREYSMQIERINQGHRGVTPPMAGQKAPEYTKSIKLVLLK